MECQGIIRAPDLCLSAKGRQKAAVEYTLPGLMALREKPGNLHKGLHHDAPKQRSLAKERLPRISWSKFQQTWANSNWAERLRTGKRGPSNRSARSYFCMVRVKRPSQPTVYLCHNNWQNHHNTGFMFWKLNFMEKPQHSQTD